MSKSKISENERIVTKTLARFDNQVKLEDVVGSNSNAISEKNTLSIQVLLEVICGIYEPDAQKRRRLFRKMWEMITGAQLADQNIDLTALNSVRLRTAEEFLKHLTKESLKIQATPLHSLLPSPVSIGESSAVYVNKYLDEFYKEEKIGEGGFGKVYKAQHRIDGVIYAIKKIKFKYKSDADYEKVIREVKSFATLNHLNVVGYNQAWFENVMPSESNSSEEESSNSPSKENSNFNTENYSKEYKSGISGNSQYSTDNSIIFKRNTISEKYDDELVTFRDTFSHGSFGNIVKETTKQAYFNQSSESKSDSANTSSKTNFSSPGCSRSKRETELDCIVKIECVEAVLYIQMEYCDGVLRHWLDERAKGNPSVFRLTVPEIFRDILNGVAHIHSKSIIHRDLKPQNIFYSSKNKAMKIGDFGLATLTNSSVEQNGELLKPIHYSTGCGTIPYSAPEQRKKHKYDSKVDMYSLGVILIELLIDAKTRMEFNHELHNILNNKIPEKILCDWPDYVFLVKNLVQEVPELRLSAQAILNQPPMSNNIEVQQRLEIKELKEKLEKKELEWMTQKIELNGTLQRIESKLAEKESKLAEKESELAEKDRRIKELEAMLYQKNLLQHNYINDIN